MAAEAPLLIGIDVGTSSVRTLIFDVRGAQVAEASTPTPTEHPRHGWAEYEPAALWQAVVRTLGEAIAAAPAGLPIAGVAVASVGESAVALDHRDEPLHNAIAWYDPRTQTQARQLAETIGAERLFAVTGLALDPIFGLCKVMWLRANASDAFGRVKRWLNVADWVAFKLSGVAATDYSLASRMLLLDLAGRRWSRELLAATDVPAEIFAELRSFGTALGPVRPGAAEETGLPTTAIVGVGGHDHICGALAEGVTRPGVMLDSVGTAEALLLMTPEPRFDEATRTLGFTQGAMTAEHGYIMGGVYTSGGAIEWFRNAIAPGVDHPALIAAAAGVPPASHGTLFLPHLRYGPSPAAEQPARGAFVGLTADSDRGILFRALLEGLALEARMVADAMQGLPGMPAIDEIRVTGGGARNDLLLKIKAAVFGRPLMVSDVQESTSLGVAMLGGIAAGVYRDIDDALAQVGTAPHRIDPDPDWTARYDELYESAYRHLAPTLQPLTNAVQRFA